MNLKVAKDIVSILKIEMTCPYCDKRNVIESALSECSEDIDAITCWNCRKDFALDDDYPIDEHESVYI